ncbi:hypothetical protein BJY16_007261 [Actinoplanes octamycinicus]|uniref:Uncharacterized protein n=1 Tax=Actinoplanes octamycinicus TaxID=135948 RepID=A0A7W7H4N2_9ACTN|nr:hypothetical protein [Actinoplanes octamycinicus]MBB4743802.1 hypothetical protein [Actinoplanes octamycinicus]GIE58430.1 hypothetical protein Aoc01nite_38320 [Actinoplanes octamycinicus]
MRAALTVHRSVTISAADDPLVVYTYGAPRPGLTGGRLPVPVSWQPPLADPGTATHLTLTELSATPAGATVAHHLSWPAIDEWRSLTAAPAGRGWLLLLENTITNVTGRPLPLTGPALRLPGIAARPAARAEWQAGHTPDATVVVVDDAANLAHPPRWPAGLSPAPFDAAGFALRPGRTIAFRYAVVIAPAGHAAAPLADLGRAALSGPLPARADICPGERPPRRPAAAPVSAGVPAGHRRAPRFCPADHAGPPRDRG